MRTVLVTGANGHIGRTVVRHLGERGDRVVAVALSLTEPEPFPFPDVVALEGDCTSETEVERAFDVADGAGGGVDAVVHLAALPHQNAGTPIEVFRTNVVATFTVLAVAARRGVRRAVIASSIQATGLTGHHLGVLPDAFPLDEQQTAHLDDWYSLSKHTDEHTARMVASRWGMPVVALRFPLVSTRAGLERTAAGYADDPALAVREGWTYLEDSEAARAVACALDADTAGAHVLHVAAPDTLAPRDTDELLDAYAPDVPRRRRFTGREAPMDTSLARAVIGYVARSRHDPPTATTRSTSPTPEPAPTAPPHPEDTA